MINIYLTKFILYFFGRLKTIKRYLLYCNIILCHLTVQYFLKRICIHLLSLVHCTLCFTFYTHSLCQKLTNKVLWLKCFDWRCTFTSVIRIVYRLITTTVQEPPLKFHRFVCQITFSGILLLLQFLKSQLSNVRLSLISMLISHYIVERGSAEKLIIHSIHIQVSLTSRGVHIF